MNNVEKILKWIREVDIKTLPYDVISIGWGPKEKNGQRTNEYGLIFTVLNKKPLSELNSNQIIPKTFQIEIEDSITKLIENVTFKTDIVEPKRHNKIITYCHSPSDTVDPVKQNRLRRRVLTGGIETMTDWGNYVATLGIFVKDSTDGQVVALSNNHVFANSQVSAKLKTPNEQGFTTTLDISGYQPTGYWKTTPENDYIGKCKRSVLIGNISNTIIGYQGGYPILGITSCDAAILSLSSYNLIDSITSPNILNFDVNAPYVFATDEEIDSLVVGGSNEGAPIFRSGRTLGPIGEPGNTYSCSLSVYKFDAALVGLYSGYLSYFTNCFFVEGNVSAGAGGDSGSAMFALFNEGNTSLSAWKMIGLLFAGPEDNSYTIGCRITRIEEALKISPWNTTIPSLSSKSYTAIVPNNYNQTITLSGRVFHQVGYI